MPKPLRSWHLLAAVALVAGTVTAGSASASSQHSQPYAGATPDRRCDVGSMPEKTQGRAPLADYASGRAAKGYFCNAREVSHFGSTGGYRVARYVDKAGHVCAFYDSTLLFPANVPEQGTEGPGVYVLNMANPARPTLATTLKTPAMLSPHESLRLNVARGLLVADMGYPTWNPGFVDVYDVSKDCLNPTLDASSPMGLLGHEGGFAPDGKTFYVTSLYGHTISAVDLSNPAAPVILWTSFAYSPHGVSISNDGRTLFMAESSFDSNGFSGLTILDVSQIQERKTDPQVPLVARLTWPQVSTPQNATPFTENGHRYVLEDDEFGSGSHVGAARIIDIENLRHPFVVANMRLAINSAQGQSKGNGDPGTSSSLQGYRAHYCDLPSRVDPHIVACSFIASGLRVFDIEKVRHPVEVAYFNKPAGNGTASSGAYAMSAPAYDPARNDIWYDDGNSGFYVVHLTAGSGVTSFARKYVLPGN
jgi:hypothetical protein